MLRYAIILSAFLVSASAMADNQPYFEPPPVPGFMLHKPDKPMTLEEMKKQADEAAQKARAERESKEQQEKPKSK